MDQFRQGLEIDPSFGVARYRLGLAYTQKGMYKEAITEFQKMLSLFRDRDTLASLGYVYAVLGKQDEARKVLAELKERGNKNMSQPTMWQSSMSVSARRISIRVA